MTNEAHQKFLNFRARTTMPILPKSSYYDKNYRQTPALIRARRPYLIKNTITGLAIAVFVTGVYSWTIKAVSQDEFEDVIVPNTPISKSD